MEATPGRAAVPEVWGGVECTVNRVGDRYHDQLALTGHDRREDDLDRLAALGLRTLRYPVLWERTETAPGEFDWRWADRRLRRMRELGIEPIVGLVHHGSGPRWTSLVHASFAEGVARFARRVAERYPWVNRFTVINEPLTTARFSGLYGVWYPHARDDRSFVRALLNQCRATVVGMQAIREVIPHARLVQTEDVSRTLAQPPLARLAAFYNTRRWLSFDLLCGRVQDGHRMWPYLRRWGATVDDLAFFHHYSTPPDLLGLNYYVTSDRYLDDRLERYPDVEPDFSLSPPFVDVEAARVPERGPAGHFHHIEAAWERYRLPMAITEVHLGCSREEQLRWLRDAWTAANDAVRGGLPVRAITAWSLFGSQDWSSLVTDLRGHYEPGAFDTRGGRARPTAIAAALKELTAGRLVEAPAAAGEGWWRRGRHASRTPRRPVLITGGRGTLGSAFARACEARGLEYRLLARAELDICDAPSVDRAITEVRPWAVINAAGYVRVDDAEADHVRCFAANAAGAEILAARAARDGLPFVTFSSDLVFDGQSTRPYVEDDPVSPLNVYGRSKVEAEQRVLQACETALVVRTAAFFGPWDRWNAVTRAMHALKNGDPWMAAGDATVSPTYVPDLTSATLDLLIDAERGIVHLSNVGAATWFELTRQAAERLRIDTAGLRACTTADLRLAAPRPLYSPLASARCPVMPSLESALDRYVQQVEVLHPRTGTREHEGHEGARSDSARTHHPVARRGCEAAG